jgi:hypothetical protein
MVGSSARVRTSCPRGGEPGASQSDERSACQVPVKVSGSSAMTGREPLGAETAVQEHVRKILAQVSALHDRLRAQEQAGQSGSRNTVEVDREHDSPGGIDSVHRPA